MEQNGKKRPDGGRKRCCGEAAERHQRQRRSVAGPVRARPAQGRFEGPLTGTARLLQRARVRSAWGRVGEQVGELPLPPARSCRHSAQRAPRRPRRSRRARPRAGAGGDGARTRPCAAAAAQRTPPERLAGHVERGGLAGLRQRRAERTVVPRGRDRLGGAPEALSARANRHLLGLPRALPREWGGVGSGEGRCGAESGVVSSGADTYLSRRSAPDWGPSHQHPHPPGYHRGRRRQREASDAAAGSGAEPQHPEKFAIFVIFCFRKNAKKFPKKFGRRPRTAPRWPLVGFPLVPVCPPN